LTLMKNINILLAKEWFQFCWCFVWGLFFDYMCHKSFSFTIVAPRMFKNLIHPFISTGFFCPAWKLFFWIQSSFPVVKHTVIFGIVLFSKVSVIHFYLHFFWFSHFFLFQFKVDQLMLETKNFGIIETKAEKVLNNSLFPEQANWLWLGNCIQLET